MFFQIKVFKWDNHSTESLEIHSHLKIIVLVVNDLIKMLNKSNWNKLIQLSNTMSLESQEHSSHSNWYKHFLKNQQKINTMNFFLSFIRLRLLHKQLSEQYSAKII